MITTLNHEEPDVVPNWIMGFFDIYVKEGLLPEDCQGEGRENLINFAEYMDNYVISVGTETNINFGHGYPGELFSKVIEQGENHRVVEFENGARWTFEKNPYNKKHEIFPVNDKENLEGMYLPDPDDPARYKGIKDDVKYFTDKGYFTTAPLMGFFSGVHYFCRDFTSFLMDLALDKDFSKRIIKRIAEFNLATAKNLLECGVHSINFCDDLGTPQNLLFSRDYYTEYFLSWNRELADLCHSYGAYVHMHTHGNVNKIIDLLVDDAKMDMINPVDPNEGMDLRELKERYGDRVTLVGGIGSYIPDMEEDKLKAIIENAVKTGYKGGGYITMDASGIPDTTNKKQLEFYIRTLKKYREKYGAKELIRDTI